MEVLMIILEFVVAILIFGVLFVAGKFIYKKLKNSDVSFLCFYIVYYYC